MGGRKEEERMPYNSSRHFTFPQTQPTTEVPGLSVRRGGWGSLSSLLLCTPHSAAFTACLEGNAWHSLERHLLNKSHFSERTQARARLPVLAGFLFHVTTPWCFLPSITTHGRVMVPLSRLKKPRIPISRCCLLTSRMHRRREQRKTSVQTQSVFRAQARAFWRHIAFLTWSTAWETCSSPSQRPSETMK